MNAVADASLGVKWYKAEPGSDAAWELLVRHAEGEVDLHMPAHCLGEVLAVCSRWEDAPKALEAWAQLEMAGVIPVPLDRELIGLAEEQMRALGCDFYDALAPALAISLDAPLYSADTRAHGAFPGVRLIR